MARYKVDLRRTEYSYATVTVEADSVREAKRHAWDEDVDWEYGDGDSEIDEVTQICSNKDCDTEDDLCADCGRCCDCSCDCDCKGEPTEANKACTSCGDVEPLCEDCGKCQSHCCQHYGCHCYACTYDRCDEHFGKDADGFRDGGLCGEPMETE